MNKYKKIVKDNLEAIEQTGKTLKDVYNVVFSHKENIAYETLIDVEMVEVTYAVLDQKIRAFACYLKKAYPEAEGQYIGVDLATSPDFLVAFWGVLMAGSRPYLINTYYPADLKLRLLKRLDAKLVITNSQEYSDFTIVDVASSHTDNVAISDEFWQNEFALSSTLTGLEAKMCVFDGEAVVNQIFNAKDIIKDNNWLMHDYEGRIKIAMILPLFHIFGIMVSYFWFAFFGQTMVFLKDNAPDTVRGTINRHKVTHIFAPPILFHKLYKGIISAILQESQKRKKKFDLGIKIAYSLQSIFPEFGAKVSRKLLKEVLNKSFGMSPRFMISGGAHIEKDALRLINCLGYPLFNGYGTTETAITGANLAKKISTRINGSIGNPFSSVTYDFEDDGGLIVFGNSLCKKIISLDSEESNFKSIKTNDLIKNVDGHYYIVGRKKDLFIGENGENISPDIIQNELKIKSASRLCVLELNGKLCIVLEYGEKMPNSVIAREVEQIKKALPDIAYGQNVGDIFITYQLIANPNAIKPSRALLRRKVSQGEVTLIDYKQIAESQDKRQESEDDETMISIKRAFSSAIDTTSQVYSDTDFFIDLGATSLDYMTLICQIEGTFGITVNLEKNRNLRTPQCFYKYISEVL